MDKVEQLQQTLNAKQALETVKRLARRPKDLVDPFALLASLEQLADCARESGHSDRRKFEAMFKQCRPLVNSPSLARVVIQLLGDKADRDVAQQIDKVLKSQPSQIPYSPPPPLEGAVGPRRGRRGWARLGPCGLDRRRCFSCNRIGHFA